MEQSVSEPRTVYYYRHNMWPIGRLYWCSRLLWWPYILTWTTQTYWFKCKYNTYTNWTCSRIPGSGIQAKRTMFLSLLAVWVKVNPFWHWMTLESPVCRGINCPQDLDPPFGVRAWMIKPRNSPPWPWIETVNRICNYINININSESWTSYHYWNIYRIRRLEF
jgi:hypothetical protein